MTAGLRVHAAQVDDGPELCALLERSAMDGAIRVVMERRPDFFAAAYLQAPRMRTLVVRDGERIVGTASCGTRSVWIDGLPKEVAYLADMRIDPRASTTAVLRAGVRGFSRLLWQDVDLGQQIIVRDNGPALRCFGEARARKLPRARELGEYASPAVRLCGPRGRRSPLRFVTARPEHVPEMQALLDAEAARKQFFPCYRLDELGQSYFRGLTLEDHHLAFDGRRLVAMAAVWDQSAMKQTRIAGYGRALGWLRPFVNALGPITGTVPLPAPGQYSRYLCVHAPVARDNDPELFAGLFGYLQARYESSGFDYLLVGFDRRDPLLAPVLRYPHTEFGGLHFALGRDADRPSLRNAPFYLEVARI